MMNLKQTWKLAAFSLAAIAIVNGCANDEFDDVSSKGQTVITAGFEQPGAKTRTAVNSSNRVVWLKNDAFKLFYTQPGGGSDGSSVFTTSDDTKQTSATFTGTALPAGATASYAVYPAANATSLSGNTLTMTLPSTLTADETSNGPMFANASSSYTNLSFKHLCGLLKLTVINMPTEAKKFIISADEVLAGTATANLESDPVLTIQDNDSRTITVNITKSATTQTFYIPLPPSTYDNLTAKIRDANDQPISKYKDKVWAKATVTRAGMLHATFGFDIEVDASTESSISQAIEDAAPKTDLTSETNTSVLVDGTLDTSTETNATISFPVYENSNISLTFDKVPTTTSKALVIKDESADAESTPEDASANVMTVAIPTVTDTAPSLEVNTPRSTTELAATNETTGTTFGKVTALTATNTLVVKNGVTVNEVVVKGGNIRINSGAEIKTFTKDWVTGVTKTIVYVEEGAKYPTPLPDGFELRTADVEKILKNGGELKLLFDISLTEPMVVEGEDVTIDLNGHKISAAGDLNKVLNTDDALILVRRGAKLTIKDSQTGGIIDASTPSSLYAAVKVTDSNDGNDGDPASLVIARGTLKGYKSAISGNGNRHNTNIDIQGGTLIGVNSTGIYHPQEGCLSISGGSIEGATTAVELRSGSLFVNGGQLTSNSVNYSQEPNGNGTTLDGAALAVSQHTTNKNINVIIQGGTFNGIRALHEVDLQDEKSDNITMKVTGGTFNGQIYSENCPAFIEGGNFYDVNAMNYLADNGNINITLTADENMDTFSLSANQTATINLNNKTLNLHSKEHDSVIYGTAVFKNGTITVVEDAKPNHTIFGLEGSNITLDKVTLNGGYYAMFVQGPGAEVKVRNQSVIKAKYFPFSTNATGSDDGEPDWGYNATITLNDSKFIGEETGFMNNVPATVTIENCEFQGNHQAALLRGGNYTIKNSTFTLNAELAYDHSENKHFKKSGVTKWGEGNQCAFAGITIGNYGGSSYQYATTVNMTGVTVKVEGTKASSFPALHACANSAEGKGVTITYDETSSFTSTYTTPIEFGTTNINVNGKEVISSESGYVVSE